VCPQQQKFESFVAPAGSTVYVSDRVSARTEGTQRVISVHGVVFAHYDLADRVAEAYAMIMLCEKSVVPAEGGLDESVQVVDFNGKGGTRTLDPGIMRKETAEKGA
jgi:hypothetical protein